MHEPSLPCWYAKKKAYCNCKKGLPNCTVRKTFECRKAFLDADNRLKMQASYIPCQYELWNSNGYVSDTSFSSLTFFIKSSNTCVWITKTEFEGDVNCIPDNTLHDLEIKNCRNNANTVIMNACWINSIEKRTIRIMCSPFHRL